MNNRQRAYLSGLASKQQAIFQIGKASLTPEIVSAVSDALEKRELIKVSVLKNCFDDPITWTSWDWVRSASMAPS